MSTPGGPARYEIRVESVLDSRWATWFGGLHVESEDTQTVISGLLADQPALHGLLAKIRDLGLCLISVRRLDPDEPETGEINGSGALYGELLPTVTAVGQRAGSVLVSMD